MKLSKFVKRAKSESYCVVIHADDSGIWLGTRLALYNATELPYMEGKEQAGAVLDIDSKAWEKMFFDEKYTEHAGADFGMNLTETDPTEQEARRVPLEMFYKGMGLVGLVYGNGGELIFYDAALIAQIADVVKTSDYIQTVVRKTAGGAPYVVIKDGFEVLAGFAPLKIITKQFLEDLSEFESACVSQYMREQKQALDAADPDKQDEGAEQIVKASNAPGTLKPILFNTEMVRAILAGKKTCTRRIAKSEKPPFAVGDILYVRETWCINTFGTHYRADWPNGACPEMDCDDQWHPSIHMGKDIARIFLRVKSVERGPLRGMEVADFQKEGVKPQNRPGGCKCAWAQEECVERSCENRDAYEWWRYMTSFRKLWDSTLPAASVRTLGWKANPDVWVIEFERTERPESVKD